MNVSNSYIRQCCETSLVVVIVKLYLCQMWQNVASSELFEDFDDEDVLTGLEKPKNGSPAEEKSVYFQQALPTQPPELLCVNTAATAAAAAAAAQCAAAEHKDKGVSGGGGGSIESTRVL